MSHTDQQSCSVICVVLKGIQLSVAYNFQRIWTGKTPPATTLQACLSLKTIHITQQPTAVRALCKKKSMQGITSATNLNCVCKRIYFGQHLSLEIFCIGQASTL